MPSALSANFVKQVTLAAQNGFIGDQETAALTRTIDSIFSKDQLKDVYDALRSAVRPETLTTKNRGALLGALYAKDQALGGGTFPLMVTMAMGEDQFGMGNVPFTGRNELISIAADGAVSKAEAKDVAALFGKVKNAFEFERLFEAAQKLVSQNLVAVSDRGTIAAAAQAAAQRVNGSGLVQTRALGEDVFGMNPAVIGNTKIETLLATATKNGALSAAEVKVLAREIKTLDEAGLKAAYSALKTAVNTAQLSKASRAQLLGAIYTRQKQLNTVVVGAVVTLAVGEDAFGVAATQTAVDKKLLSSSTDGTLSKTEAKSLLSLVKGAKTKDELAETRNAISSFLAGNVCSPKERAELAAAVQAKAATLGTGYAVTRALGEDFFGF